MLWPGRTCHLWHCPNLIIQNRQHIHTKITNAKLSIYIYMPHRKVSSPEHMKKCESFFDTPPKNCTNMLFCSFFVLHILLIHDENFQKISSFNLQGPSRVCTAKGCLVTEILSKQFHWYLTKIENLHFSENTQNFSVYISATKYLSGAVLYSEEYVKKMREKEHIRAIFRGV